ncbi:MAG: hypothetical protein JNJ61_19730, partial [Anaerolineae bacterium]|nr:hypothetical protein [Anaerolineae bacterium]
MSIYHNPFPTDDPDRRALWEMLVARDIEAFVQQDWGMVAGDFIEQGFMGVDGRGQGNPDGWRLTFPTLTHYRDSWLRDSHDMAARVQIDVLRQAVYAATSLLDIEINGDAALLHKKFDGEIVTDAGEHVRMLWQTV